MGDNRKASLRTAWLLFCALCVSALALVTTAAGADPTPAECDLRVNDTPSKLVPCIQTDDLWDHMQAFQKIADDNPSPRRSSVAQLGRAWLQGVRRLRRAGDEGRRVRRHDPDVPVHLLRLYRLPDVERGLTDRSRPSCLTTEWNPGQSVGTANGTLSRPAASSSRRLRRRARRAAAPPATSRLRRGRIALIQRGTCNFGVKVQNAQAAGATGVVIFNEGNPGRTDASAAACSTPTDNPFIPTIPVAFTSFAIGQDLLTSTRGGAGTPPPVMSIEHPGDRQGERR